MEAAEGEYISVAKGEYILYMIPYSNIDTVVINLCNAPTESA